MLPSAIEFPALVPPTYPGSPPLEMSRSSSHHSQEEHYRHLRHPNPNPDVQAEHGAYVVNVERLEEEAERISHPASDIAEEIRKTREEQKTRDSRSSTMHSRRAASGDDSQSPLARQFSYEYGSHASNSVIGTNNLARSGGYSPTAYVGSPRGSIRSGSWEHVSTTRSRHNSQPQAQPVRLAQLISEQLSEQGFRGADVVSSPVEQYHPQLSSVPPPPRSSGSDLRITNGDPQNVHAGYGGQASNVVATTDQPTEPERPSTHASTDTFEKSKDLFENFDGVHTQDQASGPSPPDPTKDREEPQVLPQFMDRRVSSMEAPPLEEMVYYPAPVPALINLPQRLSRLPAAPQRDKRRTQFLSTLEETTSGSAVWPQNPLSPGLTDDGHRVSQTDQDTSVRPDMGDLPPQLRATVYFDYPSVQQEVQLKDGSAVKTLDSILDASASLPVTAFTDHPFIGNAGANIYNKLPGQVRTSGEGETRRRSSSLNLLKRSSKSNLLADGEPRKSSFLSLARIGRQSKADGDDGLTQPHTESEAASLHHEAVPLQADEQLEQDEDEEYHDADEQQIGPDAQAELDEASQPATLLGELELRKRQQKQRTRTAGGAPNGMHATLLQQDAIAQLQKSSREKHKVTLAWEDAHVHDKENEDNEDVPLAMLYPNSKVERHQPMGMIARREMEDNEPLSHRRARLRGEDPLAAQRQRNLQLQMARAAAAKRRDTSIEDEEETLGQRRERLRREKEAEFRPVSGDFASEIMSQLGGFEVKDHPAPSKTPEGLEDETLGQRRKRLQAEQRSREVSGNNSVVAPTEGPAVAKRRSMADILHAHPTVGPRIISNGSGRNHVFAPAAPTQRQTSWSQNVNQSSLSVGLGAMANGSTRQHDMVDRWRQSIQS